MKKLMRRIPVWAKVVAAVVLFIAVVYFLIWAIPNKKLKSFEARQNSSCFYDRNGVLLYVLPLEEGLRREYKSLNDFPQELIQAFLEAEDKNFYWHPGVDPISVIRAAGQNKQAGKVVSGASTITMQLARLIYPRQKGMQVNFSRKVKEMFLAFYLEIKYSKKQILELYLNNVPFGYQVEGVASASRSFFGVEPNALSLEQMKVLATIPRRPSDYAPEKIFDYPNLCPHFVNYIVKLYKEEDVRIPNNLFLSIDSELNELTEKQIQRKLDEYRSSRIHNGSAFVMDNRTGEIIVWVGNASYEDTQHSGQIDGVMVENQPGSSMKPFLYALALENGFHPYSVLPDIEMDFGGQQVYVPLNFNNKFNGPVRYRISLASSLNVPAVYLLYNMTIDKYMEQLLKMGFTSLEGERETTGLSLALGSNGVRLYEMVHAFSNFVNDGKIIPITFNSAKDTGSIHDGRKYMSRIQNKADSSKLNQSGKVVKAYQKDTARIMCDILSDKSARSLGFGWAKVFDTQYDSIFKTGTSNQYQNIIALGATSNYTVGVWMGNFEGETVIRQTGSSVPAQIVRGLLDELTAESGAENFKEPEDYTKQAICSLSGMMAGPNCPTTVMEWVHKEDREFEKQECNWHFEHNGKIAIEYPTEYQHWANRRNYAGSSKVGTGTPLSISYPNNKATFLYDYSLPDSVQKINVKAIGGSESIARLYMDNQLIGEASSVFAWDVPLKIGSHTLTVECGQQTDSVTIFVK